MWSHHYQQREPPHPINRPLERSEEDETLKLTRLLLCTNIIMVIILTAFFILFAIFASQSQELKNLIVTGVKVEKELNEKANAATIALHNMVIRSEHFVDAHQSFFTTVDNFMYAMEKDGEGGDEGSNFNEAHIYEDLKELKTFIKEVKELPLIFNQTISIFLNLASQMESSDIIHSITRTSNLTSSLEERILDMFSK